tara:strand:+ start:361 stop:2685 length:2325 start_codon:yes stop_codon:yes gene_type:complete
MANYKDLESPELEAQQREMQEKRDQKVIDETVRLFDEYRAKRDTWATHAQEDREFRLGKQWTTEQKRVLESRGQSPVVVNRIHPAVETAKAMITANRPAFKCSPREDSDNKMANVMSGMLTYMYDISDGRSIVRQVVDDYYVTGLGYMLVYQDAYADMNKGEVKITEIDPLDVYVDPNSRSRFFDDASNIIISRRFSKNQAAKLYPIFKAAIENANGDEANTYPVTERVEDMAGSIQFPSDVGDVSGDDYVRGFERYEKVQELEFRCYETWTDKEFIHPEEKYREYLQTQVWLVGNDDTPAGSEKILDSEKEAIALITQMKQAQDKMYQGQLEQDYSKYIQYESHMLDKGAIEGEYDAFQPPKKPPLPTIEQASFADLVQSKRLQCVQVTVPRIQISVIIGDTLLYERILPVETYPIVPFVNLHTRTPYPVSDVRMIKPLQQYINKTRSLIIAHATTSTNTKILIPEGSVNMKDFEEKWAQPGVAIAVDMDAGMPIPVQPVPLPNELYRNEETAKSDIDHQLGLFEMMMGNSQAAPQTYKATISLDEFGQRKIKSKLSDIEAGLTRVARVAIPMMQQLYTQEKVFRVIQPNNSIDEYVVNKKLVDDKTNEIEFFNDVGRGRYDVVVVAGSTLPTNRYAELEFYMDAYSKGIIDKQEVLKKTEIFDAPGVLQRGDVIAQMEGALKQAEEQIKSLKGDLQTRDRESVNLKKKVETSKFDAKLDKLSGRAELATKLHEERLGDTLSLVKNALAEAKKAQGKLGTPPKEAPKKKGKKK